MRKIALILLLVLAACSDPRKAPIPADLTKLDPLKESVQKLPEEDQKLLVGYLGRRVVAEALSQTLAKDTPIAPRAATVGDAIEEQKKWQTELAEREKAEADLKAKLKAQKDGLAAQVAQTVTVTVVGLSVIPEDIQKNRFSAQQQVDLGFENKSQKDIAGVKGTVHFTDMFGTEFANISFSYTDGIAAGKTAAWSGSRDINEFKDADKALAQAEEGKYKTRFEPEMIVFSDGTKLEIPQK